MGRLLYYLCRIMNRRPASIFQSSIDKRASVGNGAQIVNCTIGKYSYVYNSNVIHTEIGAFCSIAGNCTIGGGAHPLEWVSTSPVFYKGRNCLKQNFSQNEFIEYKKTIIGNDVWIGSKCVIKGGIIIGDGAVIGMGSVVTHDVPPYEIWAGNPAKFIRKRFDDITTEKLLKVKWWNWSDEDIKKYGQLFNDPEKLLSTLSSKA